MGSNSNIRGKGGNKNIILSADQLPPHRHYIAGGFNAKANKRIKDNKNGTVSSSAQPTEGDNNNRYKLRSTIKQGEADEGLTSTVGK